MERVQAMNHLLTVEFDRKLKQSQAIGVPQIHGFCDGGKKAYGAFIFLRWEIRNGSHKFVAVSFKSFVTPLKRKTIPRLELMGCLFLARIYESCRKSLLGGLFYRPFKPFVSTRLEEIQETVVVESSIQPTFSLEERSHPNSQTG